MKISQIQNSQILTAQGILKGWSLVCFEDLFLDDTRNATKIKAQDYMESGNFPIIDQGQAYISGYSNDGRNLYKGTLPVIIFGDHTRVLKYINKPFYLGADGVKLLTVRNTFSSNAVDIKYLYYFLKTVSIPNTGYNRHFKFLKDIIIPLPPLETQKMIAKVLDKALVLIDKRKEQLTKLDEFIQSVFVDMFGDPFTHKHKWAMASLNEICTKITDGTHDTPKRLTEGVPIITGKNIKPFHLDLNDVEYVSKEDHKIIYQRCNPEYSDILYTNIGVNMGTAVMCPIEYEFSMKNVALLKHKRDVVNARYLECYLNHSKHQIVGENSLGGAQTFLGLGTIKSINISIPPIQIQEDFSGIFDKVIEQKIIFNKSLTEMQNNCNSIMQRAFKGELF